MIAQEAPASRTNVGNQGVFNSKIDKNRKSVLSWNADETAVWLAPLRDVLSALASLARAFGG
jgi:hypothetical protein